MNPEIYKRIGSFLEAQKQQQMRLDEAEGYTKRERSGFDWTAEIRSNFDAIAADHGEGWGRKIGLREALYDQTIDWAKANLLPGGELEKLGDMAKFAADKNLLQEDTLSTAAPTFTTALLPAVRRIYHKLIAMDLVSVQPLAGPTGYLWYIDKLFGTTGGGGIAGQRLDQRRRQAYAASGEQGTIRDINLRIQRLLIETINYKLKMTWTIESEQDFRSQWKTDVEGELSPELLDEIAREIDHLILLALVAGVGYNVNWSRAYPATDTTTPDRNAYHRTILKAIQMAASYIAKKKGILPNYLVFGPDVWAFLTGLNEFELSPDIAATGLADMVNFDRRYVGTLNKQYACYLVLDPNVLASNIILMGIRGTTWKYATSYFAPYIPLFMSAKYIVQDDFTQFAKGAMTRFAYGVIPETPSSTVNKGLATVTITAS